MVRHPKKVPPDLSMPVQTMEREVEREFEGLRLDAYLRARLPWRSREVYQRMIRSGAVLLNEEVRKPSTPVRWRDVVWIDFGEPADLEQDPSTITLNRILEDDDLVVLNKQPGVIVHPTGRSRFNTLMNALHLQYRDMENPERDVVPKLVHRLDRNTSGVLLVTKTRQARAECGRQFEEREVEKEYLALVHGEPREDEGMVETPIVPMERLEPGRPTMTTTDPGVGPVTRTGWRVEERFRRFTLLRVFLYTGRTHQIRVHCAHIGHPLVADEVYGDGRPLWASTCGGADDPERGEAPLIARTALHSARLVFAHPRTKERMDVRAPLYPDLVAAVEGLREAR